MSVSPLTTYVPGDAVGLVDDGLVALVGVAPDHEVVAAIVRRLEDGALDLDGFLTLVGGGWDRARRVRCGPRGGNRAVARGWFLVLADGEPVGGRGESVDRVVWANQVRLSAGSWKGGHALPVRGGVVLAQELSWTCATLEHGVEPPTAAPTPAPTDVGELLSPVPTDVKPAQAEPAGRTISRAQLRQMQAADASRPARAPKEPQRSGPGPLITGVPWAHDPAVCPASDGWSADRATSPAERAGGPLWSRRRRRALSAGSSHRQPRAPVPRLRGTRSTTAAL